MKLSHARVILQDERYLTALRVVAEAEAEEKIKAELGAETEIPEVPVDTEAEAETVN